MRLFQVHERLGKLLTVRSRAAGIVLVTPQELAKYRSNKQKICKLHMHTPLILPMIMTEWQSWLGCWAVRLRSCVADQVLVSS